MRRVRWRPRCPAGGRTPRTTTRLTGGRARMGTRWSGTPRRGSRSGDARPGGMPMARSPARCGVARADVPVEGRRSEPRTGTSNTSHSAGRLLERTRRSSPPNARVRPAKSFARNRLGSRSGEPSSPEAVRVDGLSVSAAPPATGSRPSRSGLQVPVLVASHSSSRVGQRPRILGPREPRGGRRRYRGSEVEPDFSSPRARGPRAPVGSLRRGWVGSP